MNLVGDDQKWYSSEGGIVSKFDCTEFHEHSWMHNFPKRLGTMPQSKSVMNWFHTKNVTMLKLAGNSPDLNPIENLRTLIKKKFLHQIRQLWIS